MAVATPFALRALSPADAPAAAQIVLSHFSSDPGYTYVWGHDADREGLLSLYTGKLTRLVEDEYVQTWGAFDPADGSLRAFAAWNPPSYTKSWSLYLRQGWARRTRGLVLPWPLSYIVPPAPPKAAATATGQKARFDRIFALRKDMISRIPPDPRRIWLMHFAGDDDAVDQLMRERVLRDADEYGSAIHMQTQHTMAGVVKAQETWGFKMVTEDVFVDRETRIPMWLLLRPAKK